MNFTKLTPFKDVDWLWYGEVKFSAVDRNYRAKVVGAEPRVFLHKKDAKAWVEVTAKLNWATTQGET